MGERIRDAVVWLFGRFWRPGEDDLRFALTRHQWRNHRWHLLNGMVIAVVIHFWWHGGLLDTLAYTIAAVASWELWGLFKKAWKKRTPHLFDVVLDIAVWLLGAVVIQQLFDRLAT